MKIRYLIIIAICLLFADQASKVAVKLSMTLYETIPVLGDWFTIRFVENDGAAWGLGIPGDFGKLILSLFRIVACVFIFIFIGRLNKRKAPIGVQVAFVLILVGALGNVLDSAFYGLIFSESTQTTVAHLTSFGDGYGTFLHGKVVDMVSFSFFPAIFNLADSYISVAMVYLVIFQWKYFSDKKQPDQIESKK